MGFFDKFRLRPFQSVHDTVRDGGSSKREDRDFPDVNLRDPEQVRRRLRSKVPASYVAPTVLDTSTLHAPEAEVAASDMDSGDSIRPALPPEIELAPPLRAAASQTSLHSRTGSMIGDHAEQSYPEWVAAMASEQVLGQEGQDRYLRAIREVAQRVSQNFEFANQVGLDIRKLVLADDVKSLVADAHQRRKEMKHAGLESAKVARDLGFAAIAFCADELVEVAYQVYEETSAAAQQSLDRQRQQQVAIDAGGQFELDWMRQTLAAMQNAYAISAADSDEKKRLLKRRCDQLSVRIVNAEKSVKAAQKAAKRAMKQAPIERNLKQRMALLHLPTDLSTVRRFEVKAQKSLEQEYQYTKRRILEGSSGKKGLIDREAKRQLAAIKRGDAIPTQTSAATLISAVPSTPAPRRLPEGFRPHRAAPPPPPLLAPPASPVSVRAASAPSPIGVHPAPAANLPRPIARRPAGIVRKPGHRAAPPPPRPDFSHLPPPPAEFLVDPPAAVDLPRIPTPGTPNSVFRNPSERVTPINVLGPPILRAASPQSRRSSIANSMMFDWDDGQQQLALQEIANLRALDGATATDPDILAVAGVTEGATTVDSSGSTTPRHSSPVRARTASPPALDLVAALNALRPVSSSQLNQDADNQDELQLIEMNRARRALQAAAVLAASPLPGSPALVSPRPASTELEWDDSAVTGELAARSPSVASAECESEYWSDDESIDWSGDDDTPFEPRRIEIVAGHAAPMETDSESAPSTAASSPVPSEEEDQQLAPARLESLAEQLRAALAAFAHQRHPSSAALVAASPRGPSPEPVPPPGSLLAELIGGRNLLRAPPSAASGIRTASTAPMDADKAAKFRALREANGLLSEDEASEDEASEDDWPGND